MKKITTGVAIVAMFMSFVMPCALAVETKELKGGVNQSEPLKGGVESYSEFRILNDVQVDINDIDGPGRASSSLSDGTNYLENLNIYGKGNYGELDYIFNAGGRFTNNGLIDQKEATLTSLRGLATYRAHTITAGDVFESFSQYTLNTNIKGISYRFYDETDDRPEVTAIYGYAYPRWDSFFKDNNSRTMQRKVYGINLQKQMSPIFDLGFSALRSEDNERLFASDTQYDNTIYSTDYEYRPIQGLTLRGENAFSHGKKQATSTSGYDRYYGQAHRFEAIGVGGPSRVIMDYEYVGAGFETLVGSAIQGRQKARARWTYQPDKLNTFNYALMWYQTGMGLAAANVNTVRPEFAYTRKRFLGRRYAQAGVDYKLNRSTGAGRKSNDHFVNFNYRDRVGFVDCDNQVGFNTFNTTSNGRKSLEYNYHSTFSSRYRKGDYIFKPSLNLGTNFVDDEIRNTFDKIAEYSIGLGVDAPKKRISSNIKFGQNMLNAAAGDNSNKFFTNISIYYRPGFSGFLNSSTFFLRLALNDFNFTTKTRNFSEKSISMGMNIPADVIFGKKKSKEGSL